MKHSFGGKASLLPICKYVAAIGCMALFNFSMPQREPLSLPLLYALLVAGLHPLPLCLGYIAATAASLSLMATLSGAIQAVFLLLVFSVYRRLGRAPSYERVLFPAVAQLPFLFLFPHAGYGLFPFAVLWQKAILAAFFVLFALLFEGGVRALVFRAFRCRLSAGELAELCLLWLSLGLGVAGAFHELVLVGVSLFLLLGAAVFLKSAAAVPFALAVSLPLCLLRVSAVPAAELSLYACVCLLLLPYGRAVSALSLLVSFPAVQYLEELYRMGGRAIAFTLLCCVAPVLLVLCVPEELYRRLRRSLLFYRERTLPRIAINRNRRAVGERLYEVSALFREIEVSFRAAEHSEPPAYRLREKLTGTLCTSCSRRKACREAELEESLDKLIAVGKAKGKVNLIDLPSEVTAACVNPTGLIFALNKHLGDYQRFAAEMEAAREGKRLLAEQAHGVSEILRDLALEQSEEFSFSEEEGALSSALAAEGMLSSEIFIYGEGTNFTVSMTLESDTDGKRLCAVASEALKVPLALSEKLPLLKDRACFILKRKPCYDAAFGIASRTKNGETESGDTHSILRIDERRFLVALSDGMGSGGEARSVSDRTLSLLESFYKAKMPSETVLGTVNRLIAFSGEETFSCLDLAAVDLDTGGADIVKIGSPAGFLLSGEELRVLEGESLPIGMLECIHPATMQVEMRLGDFLIFMSDGVSAAFGSVAELCSYLSALKPLNPQSLAEEILKNALSRYRGAAEDDMTVLAVKLLKGA